MSNPFEDGGPAYPQHGWSSDPATIKRMAENGGMTLRDYFAGQALAGHCANSAFDSASARQIAEHSFEAADAMLAIRKEAAK